MNLELLELLPLACNTERAQRDDPMLQGGDRKHGFGLVPASSRHDAAGRGKIDRTWTVEVGWMLVPIADVIKREAFEQEVEVALLPS